MTAPFPFSPSNVLAALGARARPETGGTGAAMTPDALKAKVPEDSGPGLLPLARLVEFHTVLIMPAGPARDALAMALWDQGMLVTTFATPHQAEGVLVGEAVHAVLVDATLGSQVGPQLAWYLNAVGRGAVQVVLFGAMAPEQRAAAVEGGVAHVLGHAVNPSQFAKDVARTVGFTPQAWRR